MTSRRSDFERALRLRLAFHIREVRVIRRDDERFRSRLPQRLPAGEVGTDLQQRASLVDAGFFDQCGLIRARLRQDKRPAVARRAPRAKSSRAPREPDAARR